MRRYTLVAPCVVLVLSTAASGQLIPQSYPGFDRGVGVSVNDVGRTERTEELGLFQANVSIAEAIASQTSDIDNDSIMFFGSVANFTWPRGHVTGEIEASSGADFLFRVEQEVRVEVLTTISRDTDRTEFPNRIVGGVAEWELVQLGLNRVILSGDSTSPARQIAILSPDWNYAFVASVGNRSTFSNERAMDVSMQTTLNAIHTPEPSTWLTALLALSALAWHRIRKAT